MNKTAQTGLCYTATTKLDAMEDLALETVARLGATRSEIIRELLVPALRRALRAEHGDDTTS
jgi:hypothetical protein